jgi:hypothetical protein
VENLANKRERKLTYITWSSTNDKYIKMSTGFPSKASFIAFVCILCEGNIETINKRVSNSTWWYEEWLAYFQVIWCKHVTRWRDAEFKCKTSQHTLRRIFDGKIKIHIKIRNKWPVFVTFKEDEQLRKQYWNDEYKGRRLVMWDNTDVKIFLFPKHTQ